MNALPRALTWLSVGLLAAACSREPEQPPNALLELVPADTPYVFATTRPLPPALLARQEQLQVQQFHDAVLRLDGLRQAGLGDGATGAVDLDLPSERVARVMTAFMHEMQSAARDDAGLAGIGLKSNPQSVLYGRGLLPVFKAEIADPVKLEAFLARVEQRSGMVSPRGRLGQDAYRRITLAPVEVVIAVSERFLTLALLTTDGFDDELPHVLGQRRPARALAATPILEELRAAHGYPGYGEGYVDLRRLLDRLLGRTPDGLHLVLAQHGAAPPALSAACGGLLDDLVAGMPRYALGIARAEDELMVLRGVLETSAPVAGYLRKIAHPVPGLGQADAAVVSVGMGVDLPQLRNAIDALLRTLIEQGEDCEWIDAGQLRAAMPRINLALGPMTAGIKGFRLRFDDLQFTGGDPEPTSFRGSLLAMVDDPRGVFALLGMFNPGLARLDVPADGLPVRVPDELIPPDAPPLSVAIRDKALLVMAAAEPAPGVSPLFDAPLTRPHPILAVDYRMGALLQRLGDSLLARVEQGGDPSAAGGLRDQLDGMRAQAAMFERISMTLYATDKGLVGEQTMYFK